MKLESSQLHTRAEKAGNNAALLSADHIRLSAWHVRHQVSHWGLLKIHRFFQGLPASPSELFFFLFPYFLSAFKCHLSTLAVQNQGQILLKAYFYETAFFQVAAHHTPAPLIK